MGYRWYEANKVAPLFPFGFGLSYTTFEYTALSVVPVVNAMTGHVVLTISYRITNTGTRRGAEASQVYLTLPPVAGEPSSRLVGFQKVELDGGASQLVTMTIDSSSPNHPLSYFNPDPSRTWGHGNWVTPAGAYTVLVGSSSADTPLRAAVDLNVVAPPVQLQLIPGTIDLSNAGRPVAALLTVPAPYSLFDLHITDLRFEGVPALQTGFASDGHAMIAIFDGSRVTDLPAGQDIAVSVAANIINDGTPDKLWVETTATVLK